MPSAPDASPALDAARERVVRLLTDRYADDTLSVEQFEAELDRLHQLTDIDAMERMAGELTTGARPAAARVSALPTYAPLPYAPLPNAPPLAGLGWQRGALVPARVTAEGRVVAIMSQRRREGQWAVPRSLHVFAIMSEAVVDLRHAVFPPEGCHVEISAIMTNVKLLLPSGVDTVVDVMAFMGVVRDHTRTEPSGHAPRVRVTGTSVMSEVQVFGSDLEPTDDD